MLMLSCLLVFCFFFKALHQIGNKKRCQLIPCNWAKRKNTNETEEHLQSFPSPHLLLSPDILEPCKNYFLWKKGKGFGENCSVSRVKGRRKTFFSESCVLFLMSLPPKHVTCTWACLEVQRDVSIACMHILFFLDTVLDYEYLW